MFITVKRSFFLMRVVDYRERATGNLHPPKKRFNDYPWCDDILVDSLEEAFGIQRAIDGLTADIVDRIKAYPLPTRVKGLAEIIDKKSQLVRLRQNPKRLQFLNGLMFPLFSPGRFEYQLGQIRSSRIDIYTELGWSEIDLSYFNYEDEIFEISANGVIANDFVSGAISLLPSGSYSVHDSLTGHPRIPIHPDLGIVACNYSLKPKGGS